MPDALTRATPGGALVVGIDRTLWRAHVWAAAELKPADKLVCLTYAEHAGRGTTAVWVEQKRLELMTGLKRTAVKEAERRLTAAGWFMVSQPARQHRRPRFALAVPPHPSGEPRRLLDEQDDTPARVSESDSLTTSQGVGIRQPEPPRVSESGARVSESGARVSESDTGTSTRTTTQPTNPRASVDDQLAAVRREAATRLVVVVREAFPGPTTGLRFDREADALRAAGWNPETLTTALAAVDLTGARSPGAVLRGRLRAMADAGPPPAPRKPAAATSTTCPVHGTTTSGACSSCSADHKAGQHRDDEDGPSTACHLCTSSRRSAA